MIPFTPNPADKSSGAHHDNHHFQRMIAQKEHTAPQHTRFILPLIHPTKSSLRCVGGIFLLWVTHLENFMSRTDVIPTFRQRRCTNRGRNFVRSKRWPPLHEQHNLYLFLRLNNSETFVELVGARPLHLLSQTVLPLKSPTGAFIAPRRFANAVYAFWAQR